MTDPTAPQPLTAVIEANKWLDSLMPGFFPVCDPPIVRNLLATVEQLQAERDQRDAADEGEHQVTIKVTWSGYVEYGRATIEAYCDRLMEALLDDSLVVDPCIASTFALARAAQPQEAEDD